MDIYNKQIFRSFIILFFLLQLSFNSEMYAFKRKDYLVTAYGAVGDGKTLNTKAIQKAIDAANKNKGGKVVFSKGEFLSGSIVLKSGVELFFEEGAILLGSTNPEDYPKYEGIRALIIANEAKNIAVNGKGSIDGQGRELALAIDSLHHTGVRIDPKYNYRRMRPEDGRGKLISFVKCDSITMINITLKDSPGWVQCFTNCKNIVIDSMKVNSTAYWNNDGIDIDGCENVRITNCNVNAADDGICLKSESPGLQNNNIYIANCRIRSSANAVKFGTGSYGSFKNVTIENIKVFDTFRSAIAIESVDGAEIENIKVSNITAVNTGNAILIRLGHRNGDQPGYIKNVSIKNVKAQIPFGRPDMDYDLRGPEVDYFHNPFPASIAGIPGHLIENVTLENIEITYPGRASKGMAYHPLSRLKDVKENINGYPEFTMFGELPSWGFYVRHVNGIEMKNIKLILEKEDFRPAFVFDDVKNLTMKAIEVPSDKTNQIVFKDVSSTNLDSESLKRKTEPEQNKFELPIK
ncbi:glycoside hydrolase family 28 protein [Flavobacterium circumlabens]|uniref:Glycoside hydrolase family 28 protein n=1 Tax=Flavobacterium circumlabens TaxID=2133765 RepID=A0A4Y7U7R7_9FLAO|nr:glycosyl hydrolase family 28 protein [Flavobacterium circumlabens]TCN53164.1 glycosyl hydrolase family 28 [Flavobacterium circumlabens]TEB42294.1 glycoside hydrolase family 28 protein [Flavobacterium circumlabens]